MAATPVNKHYQLHLIVKDKRFSIDQLRQYHLSIWVGNNSFKVSCIERANNRCLLLMVYQLAYDHAYERVHAIEQIYHDQPLLVAGTWSGVTLCIDNQQYSLIPERLFQEKKAVDYLNFACSIGSNTVQHFVHPSLNLAVAFAVDSVLLSWFQETYSQTDLHTIHQASSLIEGVWRYMKLNELGMLPKVFAFVDPEHLHLISMQKGILLYYNRFRYTSSDELLHYILLVMRTLKLDSGFHEVILSGNITKCSLAYKKARNYIRNLTLSGRPPYVRFRRNFKKEITTAHFDLLSTHWCDQAS